VAVNIADVVMRLERLMSYDKIQLRVTTQERSVIQDTTAQRGISSLMGLIMATSGCPHLAVFRPMARFHLPLANEEETIYRATSMYLLAQYFVKKQGGTPDLDLEGLTTVYENVEEVNACLARRLRAASSTDSAVNAVVLLDMHAKNVPWMIEESLEKVRCLFAAYLAAQP